LFCFCLRGFKEFFVKHHKKKWKVRAHDAADNRGATNNAAFENALLGDDQSSRKSFDPREDRKMQQLCRQVQRALMLGLAGECNDEVLRDLYIDSVEPMGNGSQLLVSVTVPASVNLPVWNVVGRLNARSARLRAIVAQAICRKRVPSLMFVAFPQNADLSEGESHE
jgi:hypothetical protein